MLVRSPQEGHRRWCERGRVWARCADNALTVAAPETESHATTPRVLVELNAVGLEHHACEKLAKRVSR